MAEEISAVKSTQWNDFKRYDCRDNFYTNAISDIDSFFDK